MEFNNKLSLFVYESIVENQDLYYKTLTCNNPNILKEIFKSLLNLPNNSSDYSISFISGALEEVEWSKVLLKIQYYSRDKINKSNESYEIVKSLKSELDRLTKKIDELEDKLFPNDF